MKINKKPKVCNLCGGAVVLVKSYKLYGSGYRYLCKNCGAFVGTYDSKKKNIAYGILADEEMRLYKRHCKGLFNSQWRGDSQTMTRGQAIKNLCKALSIKRKDCNIDSFDLEMLKRAFEYLKTAGFEEAESESDS